MCIEKSDARKLKPEVQQQLRNQAVHLFKKGWKNQKIAGALGVSHVYAGRWCSAYTKHGRSYSLRGKTQGLRLPAKKERINLISSVRNQGQARFMIYDGTMNSDTFIKFMKRLIKDACRKIYLILDTIRVHHNKPVKSG